MKTTKKWLCCLLCVTMLLMLPSCKKKSVTPQDEIIYYSIPFEPDSLDPQIANDSSSRLIVMNIYEGLTRLNQSEVPVPGAAECWVISDDETTYTFILRDDACWNNGDKVTAEDFLFGLQRTLDPGTGSEGAPSLYSIKNAEAVHQGKMPMDALVAMGTAVNSSVTGLASFALLCVAPFNLLKGAVVSVITLLLYKRISSLIKGAER